MTIINPNLPANLFIQGLNHPVNTPEERQLDLRLDQMVRATVVEGGLGRTILEMNHQYFRAQTDQELQVGQKLMLQVLKTHPIPEFKVLNDPLSDRLGQLMPLLTRSYNWSRLVKQMQHQPNQAVSSQSLSEVFNRLQQLLAPGGDFSVDIKGSIAQIVAQLQQLAAPAEEALNDPSLVRLQGLIQPGGRAGQFAANSELSRTVLPLIKNLQDQLLLLPKEPGYSPQKNWYPETRKLLVPLQQGRDLSQLPVLQKELLITVLHQIRQHPNVSPQLAGEVERIMLQLEKQVSQAFSLRAEPVTKTETAISADPSKAAQPSPVPEGPRSVLGASTKGAEPLAQIAAEVKVLLDHVQGQPLQPELLGRLEGLLERLQQFSAVAGTASIPFPGLEMMISQLTQLISRPSSLPKGEQLGFLSQLFGLHLETELLHGKKKDALASLKLSLLTLQKDLGKEVEEPLRRLELFQLCKARLAEEQVQFLPLPFCELEEGYLLAEKQHRQDEDDLEGDPPLRMSLSLRLSSLGNLRVDMLYEKQGLHLRLACDNPEKMRYLQNSVAELKETVKAVALRGIGFSADAQLPARQLQNRLLPESLGMLDERV